MFESRVAIFMAGAVCVSLGCSSPSTGGGTEAASTGGNGGASSTAGAPAGGGATGGTAAAPDYSQDLWPLGPGLEWEYAATSNEDWSAYNPERDCTQYNKRTLGDAVEADGLAFYPLLATPCHAIDPGSFYLHHEGDALFGTATPAAEDGSRVTILWTPIEEGGIYEDGVYRHRWSHVGEVTVQAGRFSDCWSVTTVMVTPAAGLNERDIASYCRGAGLVSTRSWVDVPVDLAIDELPTTAPDYTSELVKKSF